MSHIKSPTRPDPTFLRLSAGTVYFFFGFLKFFPDLSPAELLAGQSIMAVTFHTVDAQTALFYLAILECFIGFCFLFKFYMRYLFFIFMFHQAATFSPIFLFPEITFKIFPFAPTLEGQYILKNLISVAAGWTILLPVAKAGWADARRSREMARAARLVRVVDLNDVESETAAPSGKPEPSPITA